MALGGPICTIMLYLVICMCISQVCDSSDAIRNAGRASLGELRVEAGCRACPCLSTSTSISLPQLDPSNHLDLSPSSGPASVTWTPEFRRLICSIPPPKVDLEATPHPCSSPVQLWPDQRRARTVSFQPPSLENTRVSVIASGSVKGDEPVGIGWTVYRLVERVQRSRALLPDRRARPLPQLGAIRVRAHRRASLQTGKIKSLILGSSLFSCAVQASRPLPTRRVRFLRRRRRACPRQVSPRESERGRETPSEQPSNPHQQTRQPPTNRL